MRPATTTQVTDAVDVGDAWAGHAVGFDVATRDGQQFVAYYDADRRLVVAHRALGDDDWQRTELPERVPWDSHNDLALAVDAAGHLHLSGNMHVDPLTYFHTTDPLDPTTFERVESLVGRDEDRVTYPRFLDGPDGLVFMYRDGSSGDGRRLLNAYDPDDGWRRLLDVPLLDGRDGANAYPAGPIRGPDGDFHLFWVWRDTPDAATNHDLSYARSADLRSWTRADGRPLDLPITPANDCLVDPVPSGGGLLNSNVAPGFDGEGRPTVTYHKHVGDSTEAFVARLEGDRWRVRQVSDWGERWDFGGGGSLEDRIVVDSVWPTPDGLVGTFWHAAHGPGRWLLDAETLAPVRTDAPWHGLPVEWRTPTEDRFDVQWTVDGEWALRWEALPPNRDRPRDEVPPPSRLRVCRLDPAPRRQT
ncbi:MAG: BNR repeat-containing protein [Halobacteriaceae archaeon]